MRYGALCLAALVCAACAGGQTGEITMLGACREPIAEVGVGEPSRAGRSAEEQVGLLVTRAAGRLHDAPDRNGMPIEVSFALSGQAAVLIGGEGCERPLLEAPVVITLASAPAAIDETLDGRIVLSDADFATVRATVEPGSVEGLALDAALLVDLSSEPDSLHGQLMAGETVLASF